MVEIRRLPDARRMANIAGSRVRDVGHILGLGIDGHIGPAMATHAVTRGNRAGEAGMCHCSRGKHRVILVAGITLRRRRDMVAWLAERVRAVVAG